MAFSTALTLVLFAVEVYLAYRFYITDDKLWMTIFTVMVGYDLNTILQWALS